MAEGFLGRWSRRKLEVKEGRPVEAEAPMPIPSPQPSPASGRGSELPSPSPSPRRGEGGGEGALAQELTGQEPSVEPAPTLDDTRDLTPASDFRRFVRADVPADVKNAALKKLFADPRFNVQDGLDVYIDDYSQPDPLPQAMLGQLRGAQFLGLARDEERPPAGARDDAGEPAAQSVAQSAASAPADASPVQPAVPPDHAHPDLRLQQDDAAEGGEPRHGAG